jgi:L-tartrate/succinate antiporter
LPPPGLAQHAWYYFALFSGVVAALVTEPIPNTAVGLVGLTLGAVLSRWVLFSPADLAKPGFNVVTQSVNWALSGFASTIVWLVGGAFMFALHYEKTGLGRRTLTLGYATTFADAILTPFTPSNTARGAGIIFPVVNSLPGLYDSHPHDRSARKIGAYIVGQRSPRSASPRPCSSAPAPRTSWRATSLARSPMSPLPTATGCTPRWRSAWQ